MLRFVSYLSYGKHLTQSISFSRVVLALTVGLFLSFLIIPMVIIIIYSFLQYESFNVIFEFSLSAWQETLLNPKTYELYFRSLLMAALVTILSLFFGYPLAYYLRFYLDPKTGIFVLLFLVIPFWTADILRVIAWVPVLSRQGIINSVLVSSGVIDGPLDWLLFSPIAQLFAYLQSYVVFMAAPIYISLSQIDEDLLAASATLSATKYETLRYVTLPLSKAGISIGSIFVFTLTIGNLNIATELSGGTQNVTMKIVSFINTGLFYPKASAIAIPLLIIIVLSVYVLLNFVDITKVV